MPKVIPITPDHDHLWLKGLRRHGNNILADESNLLNAVRSAPELHGLLRFNEFAGKVELWRSPPWRTAVRGQPWTDADDLDVTVWLQEQGIPARSRASIASVVERVALDASYHPVREYLTGLQWDGEQRLQSAAVRYFAADGPREFLAAVFRKFLIQCVARVMQPGCQADAVLVLEGPQGTGKTRAVRILGRQWKCENLPYDLGNKDAAIQLSGAWIIELAELAALRGTALEAMKSFLTRCVDRYRPAYGRRTVDVLRQCCFIGTTNATTYLRDRTGNRRYWPVRCGRIDVDALASNIDQLWAEAYSAFLAGEQWHLNEQEITIQIQETMQRELVTELEASVADYLDSVAKGGRNEVTTREVLTGPCNLIPADADYMERAGRLGSQVAMAMIRAGWTRVGQVGSSSGGTRRVVYRKQDVGGGIEPRDSCGEPPNCTEAA